MLSTGSRFLWIIKMSVEKGGKPRKAKWCLRVFEPPLKEGTA